MGGTMLKPLEVVQDRVLKIKYSKITSTEPSYYIKKQMTPVKELNISTSKPL